MRDQALILKFGSAHIGYQYQTFKINNLRTKIPILGDSIKIENGPKILQPSHLPILQSVNSHLKKIRSLTTFSLKSIEKGLKRGNYSLKKIIKNFNEN